MAEWLALRLRTTPFLALALAGALAPAPSLATQAAEAPEALLAPLRELRAGSDSLAARRGTPQVVFVVSASRLRRVKDWEAQLDRRVRGVAFLRVADVPPEPGRPRPSHEDVAATLSKRVPAGVRVLIDVERRFAETLALDTREVNVLLFDAALGSVGRARGRPSGENLERVVARLLALPGVRPRGTVPPA